jgi:hypothetical protein
MARTFGRVRKVLNLMNRTGSRFPFSKKGEKIKEKKKL